MVVENRVESNNENNDVLLSTQTVIHKALEKLGYPDEVYELLKEPLRMLTVKIPVKMDDGSVKIFTGYMAEGKAASSAIPVQCLLTSWSD